MAHPSQSSRIGPSSDCCCADSGQRMQVNDSWIAATALALGVPVVTQGDDYVDVDGLDVIKV